MISITVYTKNENKTLKGLKISGHAGYAEYGKDIICAAVSVLTTNLINSIETFTDDAIEYYTDEEKGLIAFKFLSEPSHDAILLVDSCLLGFQEIQKDNNKYIRLLTKEV